MKNLHLSIPQFHEILKLKNIHQCISSAPLKRQITVLCFIALRGVRTLRMWYIYNAGNTLYKDRSNVVDTITDGKQTTNLAE